MLTPGDRGPDSDATGVRTPGVAGQTGDGSTNNPTSLRLPGAGVGLVRIHLGLLFLLLEGDLDVAARLPPVLDRGGLGARHRAHAVHRRDDVLPGHAVAEVDE